MTSQFPSYHGWEKRAVLVNLTVPGVGVRPPF